MATARCDICEKSSYFIKFYCNTCGGYLCEQCCNGHLRIKLFEKHDVKSINAIDREKQVNESQINIEDVISEKCRDHLREYISFYCGDHDTTGCGRCHIKKHKRCREIVDLTDIKENKTLMRQIENYRNRLCKLVQALEDIETNVKKNKSISLEQKERCQSDANQFIEEIVQPLHQLKLNVIQSIEVKHEENIEKLDKVQNVCAKTKNELVKHREVTNAQFNSHLLANLFLYTKRTSKVIKDLEAKVRGAESDNQISTFDFVKDADLQKAIKGPNVYFGRIQEVVNGSDEVINSDAENEDKMVCIKHGSV